MISKSKKELALREYANSSKSLTEVAKNHSMSFETLRRYASKKSATRRKGRLSKSHIEAVTKKNLEKMGITGTGIVLGVTARKQKSRFWKPITECKLQARRLYKGVNKRQKYEYQCNMCQNWFIEKKINVDHIHPAGSLNCAQDLPGFVDRLFCEVDNLQVLCEKCHDKKTKADKHEKDNLKAS